MKIILLRLSIFLVCVVSLQVRAKDFIHLSRICEISNNNEKVTVKYFSWYTVEDAWDDIIVEHTSGFKNDYYYFSSMKNCASDDGALCINQKCSMAGAKNNIEVNAIHKPNLGQSEPKFDNFLLDLTIMQNNKLVFNATNVTCRRATQLENNEEMSKVGEDAFPYTCSIVNGKEYSVYH